VQENEVLRLQSRGSFGPNNNIQIGQGNEEEAISIQQYEATQNTKSRVNPFASILKGTSFDRQTSMENNVHSDIRKLGDPFQSIIRGIKYDKNSQIPNEEYRPQEHANAFVSILKGTSFDKNPEPKKEANPFASILKGTSFDKNPEPKKEANPFASILKGTSFDKNPEPKKEANPFASILKGTSFDKNHSATNNKQTDREKTIQLAGRIFNN